MPEIEVQTILRCGLCHKPFDKQSTLKRHGYYCRSRNSNSRPVRPRSRLGCAKAKVRCDSKHPHCTRCVTKRIECRPQTAGSAHRPLPGNTGEHPRNRRPVRRTGNSAATTPTKTPQSPQNTDSISDQSEYGPTEVDIENFGDDQFDWNMLDTSISGMESLDDQTIQPSLLESTNPYQNNYQLSTTEASQPGQIVPLRRPSIPTMPAFSLRSFTPNPAIKGGTQATAILMGRILTSYPAMMRNQNSLPPFIHPCALSNVPDAESKSVEPLTTCMSLMQMVSTKAQGSRKLLWKNVRLECERLEQECNGLGKWELLSSMQALSIYILLRLQEGETMHNNLDVLLLSTTWLVSCALNEHLGGIPCLAPFGLSYGPSQNDLIFEESRRRLAVIFTTIRMIFSMEPASGCDGYDGILLAPLPARKQLWEARDECE